jgi:hypothetical protein
MNDVPIRTDAMSIYDTLSENDKEALRRTDDIRERIHRRLYVRHVGHGGDIDFREIGGDVREEVRERRDVILLCLIGLTQEDLDGDLGGD